MGLVNAEVVTASTIVLRTNVANKPYDDQKVRKALQLAVDNATVLKLGYNDAGTVAENHHVCPIHPEYYELPKIARDIEKAKALMTEAGQMDIEFDLIPYDAECEKNTGRRDRRAVPRGGHQGEAHRHSGIDRSGTTGRSIPGRRPSGTCVRWACRFWRWHIAPAKHGTKSAYSNPEFDAKLNAALAIADAAKRKELMKDVEQILQDSGIIIQPYWRKLTATHAPYVKNLVMHPTFEHDFGNVWLDK